MKMLQFKFFLFIEVYKLKRNKNVHCNFISFFSPFHTTASNNCTTIIIAENIYVVAGLLLYFIIIN